MSFFAYTFLKINKFVKLPIANTSLIKFNEHFLPLTCYLYPKYFLHTSINYNKGHSKWDNIKHTKQAKDLEKSQIFLKFARLIRMACKESGGTDPKLNSKLARVIEQAKNQQMPASTIEHNLKNIEKSEENAKPGVVSMFGSGGILVLVDVLTDKHTRTRQQLAAIIKKSSLKLEKSDRLEEMFEEKGVIVTEGSEKSLPSALDHAIEAGAEDVVHEDGYFTFTCAPNDFTKVKKSIEDLKYELHYADIDKIPSTTASVKETEIESIKSVISKLEQHDDVIRVHTNFEF